MIERFEAWITTIIAGLKGKLLGQDEHTEGSADDLGPTKQYRRSKAPQVRAGERAYLVTEGSAVLLRPGFSVGRGESCHLQLTDLGASRVHASFTPVGHHWLLKDNASKNGTLLNGKSIDSAVLKSGDRIQIGQTVFVYEER